MDEVLHTNREPVFPFHVLSCNKQENMFLFIYINAQFNCSIEKQACVWASANMQQQQRKKTQQCFRGGRVPLTSSALAV